MVWQRQMAERDELSSKSATGARLRDRQKGRPRGGGERSEFAASEIVAEGMGLKDNLLHVFVELPRIPAQSHKIHSA